MKTSTASGLFVALYAMSCCHAFAGTSVSEVQAGGVATDRGRIESRALDDKRQSIILQLDHGPRATTTPWLNQQRLEASRKATTARLASPALRNAPDSPADRR